MSARMPVRLPEQCRLAPMRPSHLVAVMAIENEAYAVPWTRGNFIDSLASDYLARCLFDLPGNLLGYCVAMHAAGEMHLLNLTVAPAYRGRGHARQMLDALVASCHDAGVTQLWLEVRASNYFARNLYRRYGLVERGTRKGYYPATPGDAHSGREDAVVMSLRMDGAP